MVKNLPAIWETYIPFLGWEDALEKAMATHSSILDWSIPMDEEPGGLLSMLSQRAGHVWVTKHTHCFTCIADWFHNAEGTKL